MQRDETRRHFFVFTGLPDRCFSWYNGRWLIFEPGVLMYPLYKRILISIWLYYDSLLSIIVWMFVLSILYHTGFAAMTPAIAGLFCRRTLMSPQTTKHRLKQTPHKSRPQRWCQTLWSIDPIVIICLEHSKWIHCRFYSYRMLSLSSLWFQMKIGALPGGRDWHIQHKRGCNGPARAVPFMEAGRWFKVLSKLIHCTLYTWFVGLLDQALLHSFTGECMQVHRILRLMCFLDVCAFVLTF